MSLYSRWQAAQFFVKMSLPRLAAAASIANGYSGGGNWLMNFAVTSALLTFTIFGSPATARLAAMLRKNGDFTLPSTWAMFCVPCFHVLLMSVNVASLSGRALNGIAM